MKKKYKHTKQIITILNNIYNNPTTDLIHNSPYQLLIATILSAQCTDKQVNAITPQLFTTYSNPHSLANANTEEIENIIHSTGFYHNKAKNIIGCANGLIENYSGEVPLVMEDLVTLSGVGRKTANCILSVYGETVGIVVDTHVIRLSNLLGFTKSKNAIKIEEELMEIIDKKD